MDIGVARAAEAIAAGASVCLLLIALGRPGPALAQETVAPPALSPSCEAPSADIATPEPLPRFAAALQAKRPIRVMAIGSSGIVAAGSFTAGQNYPARFEGILERTFKGLDVTVINRGVSGETASTTAERLKAQVALEQPTLVLWQVGTNDALARVPVESFVTTMRDALRWLKEHGIDVVLVGLQYAPKAIREEYFGGIRAALGDLAAAENILLVRRSDAMEFIENAKRNAPAADDEPPRSDLGSRCMAEHIARAVVVSAFVRSKGEIRRRP